jgi:hypothetical protein
MGGIQMKMSKEDYQILETTINELLSSYTKEAILEARNSVRFVKCQFTSFCWKVYYKAKPQLKGEYQDSHRTTALKQILKEYK